MGVPADVNVCRTRYTTPKLTKLTPEEARRRLQAAAQPCAEEVGHQGAQDLLAVLSAENPPSIDTQAKASPDARRK